MYRNVGSHIIYYYNFLFLQQNFKKSISMESLGYKDYTKHTPVPGNRLHLVPHTVPDYRLGNKAECDTFAIQWHNLKACR